MASGQVNNVAIRGIASAVPENLSTLADMEEAFGAELARRIATNVGVYQRHVSTGGICASDLCHAAAERLLDQLEWQRDSIDVLIFVSVTPDYLTPASSCVMQNRLGLGKNCAAFDMPHACSGYAYGLWVLSSMIGNGKLKRGLLLIGDTVSRMTSPADRAIATLIGDAGSATALEWSSDAKLMHFELGTDGSGYRHLIKKAGRFRLPATTETNRRTERENGNIRSDEDLYMNGTEIFAFSVREVPVLAKKLLCHARWTFDDVDVVVMHQANQFMIRHLVKKLDIPKDKYVENLANFGNTGGVSVPLAITNTLRDVLSGGERRLVLLGFGAGLSWGGVAVTCGPLVIPELLTVAATAGREIPS